MQPQASLCPGWQEDERQPRHTKAPPGLEESKPARGEQQPESQQRAQRQPQRDGAPPSCRQGKDQRECASWENHLACSARDAVGSRAGTGKLCPENAARERSRVRTLRQAFLALQAALPSVPPDTKLSKLDVLVLATSYIAYLTHTLHQGQPPPEAAPLVRAPSFLHPMKKWPMRSRLYAGAWGADVADMPAAAPAVPSSRMRTGCEGGSPEAGGAAL
uniref:BHLH domain-containing protein n=1 Tax=Chelonoidis abingdonii TaxID=106734 RepID=A0A8C0FZU7_CHEAB